MFPFIPEQIIITPENRTKIITAVPKSGCLATKKKNKLITINGGITAFLKSSMYPCLRENIAAKYMIKPIFAISDGWIVKPPIEIHRCPKL